MRTAMVAFRTVSVCLLSLGVARAGEKLELDQVVPFQSGAEVKVEVGPIVFNRIVVNDAPREEEIRKANDKYHTNVHPVVVMSNNGNRDAQVDLDLVLEDADGKELLSCYRGFEVDKGDEDSTFIVCNRGRMKTVDWPRVKQVHLIAHIELR